MNPLALLLAISLVGNAWLTYEYLGQRDTAVVATTQNTQTTAVATSCGQSVSNMANTAKRREADNAPERAAAAASAAEGKRQAANILATPATTPGNDCKSASDRLDRWLKGTP